MTTSSLPSQGSGPGSDFVAVHDPSGPDLANDAPQHNPAPWAAYVSPVAPPLGCKVCGVTPTAPVTIRAHRGLVVIMRWRRADGPFCGFCGIALVREMTTATLRQGWWGVGSLIIGAPVALMSNLLAYRKLRRLQLAVPVPGTVRPRLGKPVLHRPSAYVALIPLTWAVVVITHLVLSAS